MLALQTSQTGGADNEKLEALGRIVDYVFNADFSSLETLPRRMYELCTGTSPIGKSVSPQAIEAALSKLRVQHDKMTGIRWYFHPSSPKGIKSPGFYLYFGRDKFGGFYVMHLITRYFGSDWLFVKDVWAKTPDGKVSVPLSSTIKDSEWLRDHSGREVWEQFDSEIISQADKLAVRSIAYSQEVVLRFEGDKYHNDRKLSERELSAAREIIRAYEAATGRDWK